MEINFKYHDYFDFRFGETTDKALRSWFNCYETMELLTDLYKGLKKGEKSFISTFLEIEDNLIDWYNSSKLLKSDIYINQQGQLKDLLFVSSIFSDVSSIYLMDRTKSEFKIQYLQSDHPNYGKTLTIPSELGVQLSKDTHIFLPAYIYWPTKANRNLLFTYGNFIREQRVIIRPMRIMLVKDKSQESTNFINYYINPNTRSGNWIFEKEFPRNSIPFSHTNLTNVASKVFELIIPYTTNVTEKKLIRLLNDEKERISTFRKTILDIVDKYMSNDAPSEYIIRDHIRPEIDNLSIEYKELIKKSGIRIVSNLAYSFSLFLLSSNPDSENLAAIIGAGSLGYGILGATDTYIKYQDEMNSITKNPFYLFWKLDKISN